MEMTYTLSTPINTATDYQGIYNLNMDINWQEKNASAGESVLILKGEQKARVIPRRSIESPIEAKNLIDEAI